MYVKQYSVYIFLTVLCLSGPKLSSQDLTIQNEIIWFKSENSAQSDWIQFNHSKKEKFTLSFALRVKTTLDLNIQFRTSINESWIELQRNSHTDSSLDWHSELIFTSGDSIQLRMNQAHPAQIFLQIIKPHPDKSDGFENSVCLCDTLKLVTRSSWCPDGDCPLDPTPVLNEEKIVVIHHSAGATDASDFAAIVRSYYRYHVEFNGWDDIGYNYLVSPDGQIFEGRGDDLLGAHFCGTNSGTVGICLIGNYQERFPAQAGLDALRKLLAFKNCQKNIDPQGFAFHLSSGLNLDQISGHRDGCSTLCPGQELYDYLPVLRQAVEKQIFDSCRTLEAPVIQISSIDHERIQLQWNDPYNQEHGFILEIAENDPEQFNTQLEFPVNTTRHSFPFEEGTLYYFRVLAMFPRQLGPCSNIVSNTMSHMYETSMPSINQTCKLYDHLGRQVFSGACEEAEKIRNLNPYILIQK